MEVITRGELMPRIRNDGFNENQIEAESKGEGEHRVGVALVVSRAIFSDFIRLSFNEILRVLREIQMCLSAWILER